MNKRLVFSLFAAVVAFAPLALARGKKPELAPGTYKIWGEDIDEIQIAKTFRASDYDAIAVTRIDTSKTPLPDPKEKWYESAKTVLNGYTETLTEALRDEMKGKMKVDLADKAPKTSRTLILRGSVLEIDPGSRAGRQLSRYGAVIGIPTPGTICNPLLKSYAQRTPGEIVSVVVDCSRCASVSSIACTFGFSA